MKKIYVSLVKDLLGYYLEFEAQSDLAVRQYLLKEYFRDGVWLLPWCSTYTELPVDSAFKGVIKAPCGQLYEWPEMQRAGG